MLHVAGSHIEPYCEESWESVLNSKDPRGILLMWHPPRKGAKYIMGGDPTQGITGWSGALERTEITKWITPRWRSSKSMG